jgi:cytochrome b
MRDGGLQGWVRVWDPFVRIAHGVLALGFAIAWLTEGKPAWLHEWAGYAVGATVALRVAWGFVGPREARFATFVGRPSAALTYLRRLIAFRAPRFLGHSPAGGIMVVALLASLAVTTATAGRSRRCWAPRPRGCRRRPPRAARPLPAVPRAGSSRSTRARRTSRCCW